MAAESQLIEILRQEGIVSAPNLERAMAHQREGGGSVAGWLVDEGLLGEEDLFFVLSRHLGVPAVPAERLSRLTLAPEIRRRVPRELARSSVLVPLGLDASNRRLSVAMADPSDTQTLERLQQVAGVDGVSALLARRSAILDTINAIYSNRAEDTAGELQTPARQQEEAPPAPLTDALENADTGVELIPGKVSVDASLAREITRLDRGSEERTDPRPAGSGVVADAANRPTQKLPLMHGASPTTPTLKMKVPPDLVVESADAPQDATPTIVRQTTAAVGGTGNKKRAPAAPEPRGDLSRRGKEAEGLLWELLSAVATLAMALEKRVHPGAAGVQEYGRLASELAGELGMDKLAVARIVVAAQLYGLDESLRRDVGSKMRPAVAAVFSARPSAPGGLSAPLRRLGARALGLQGTKERDDLAGVGLIRLVAEALELRGSEGEGQPDAGRIAQLLRDGGANATTVAALERVLERTGVLQGTMTEQNDGTGEDE